MAAPTPTALQWKDRPVPRDLKTLQKKPYNRATTRDDIARYLVNDRFSCIPLPEDVERQFFEPESHAAHKQTLGSDRMIVANITFVYFEIPGTPHIGVKVSFRNGMIIDDEIELYCDTDSHWYEVQDHVYKPTFKITKEWTATVYSSKINNKLNYFVKIPAKSSKLYEMRLYSSKEAYLWFVSFWERERDIAPCQRPTEQLHHWAFIESRGAIQGQRRQEFRLIEKNFAIRVVGHHDYDIRGGLQWDYNDDNQMIWTEFPEYNDEFIEMLREIVMSPINLRHPPAQYELFVSEEQSNEVCYLHQFSGHGADQDEEGWYRFYNHRLSMVEHVRAELRTKFPGMAQDYLQWDSVMTNWDGSLNPVQLFVLTDEQSNLRDMKVVKPTCRDESHGRNDVEGYSLEPPELFLNKIALRVTDPNDTILKMAHNSYHYSSLRPYLLYFDYKKLGTLQALQERHKTRYQTGSPKYLNEIFLLHIFLRLVKACRIFLEDSEVKDSRGGIMISDLKPPNIILSEQDIPEGKNEAPHYPKSQLIDLEFHYRELESRLLSKGGGTRGFYAPEQLIPNDKKQLANKIDVFQIGCIMFGLMRNTHGLDILDINYRKIQDLKKTELRGVEYSLSATLEVVKDPFEGTEYAQPYSREFEFLVLRCLQPLPKDRATLEELETTISGILDAEDGTKRQTLQMTQDEIEKQDRVPLPAHDPFRLGNALERNKQREHVYHRKVREWVRDPYARDTAEPDKHHGKIPKNDPLIRGPKKNEEENEKKRKLGKYTDGNGVDPGGREDPREQRFNGGSWGGFPVGEWVPYEGGFRKKRREEDRNGKLNELARRALATMKNPLEGGGNGGGEE